MHVHTFDCVIFYYKVGLCIEYDKLSLACELSDGILQGRIQDFRKGVSG